MQTSDPDLSNYFLALVHHRQIDQYMYTMYIERTKVQNLVESEYLLGLFGKLEDFLLIFISLSLI